MKSLVRILATFFVLQFLFSLNAEADNPPIQSFKLKNGLEVIHIPNHRAPVVVQFLCYKVGSSEDPKGKSGVAHYLEHLMFRGTKKFEDGFLRRTFEELGAESNAFTSYDTTCYYQIVAKDRLEKVIELEADRMLSFSPNEKAFESEKKIILEEYQARVGNQKYTQFAQAANAAYFWHHPYGRPQIGWWEELQTISRDDALKFHQKWYAPNNAVLVIAGDVTFDETKNLVEKYYGPIPSKPNIKRNRLSEPKHFGETIHVQLRDKLIGTSIQVIYDVPNYRTAPLKEVYALIILEKILGQDATGLLYRNLVMQEKIAQNIMASYTTDYLDPYSFVLIAAPKNPKDMNQLEYAMRAAILRATNTGFSKEEVENAQKDFLYYLNLDQSNLFNYARYIGESYANGRKIEDILKMRDEILNLTPEDVQKTAEKYFKTPPRLIATSLTMTQREDDK